MRGRVLARLYTKSNRIKANEKRTHVNNMITQIAAYGGYMYREGFYMHTAHTLIPALVVVLILILTLLIHLKSKKFNREINRSDLNIRISIIFLQTNFIVDIVLSSFAIRHSPDLTFFLFSPIFDFLHVPTSFLAFHYI